MPSLRRLQKQWAASTLGTETALHQLSPYIGKLKSSIANALIEKFSKPGDLVFEPFAGSGCIALEAICLGRSVVACDVSPYAALLTRAKLRPPCDLNVIMRRATDYIAVAKRKAKLQMYQLDAPQWVRRFFHRRTLAETKHLCEILLKKREWFLLACVLGILHHQRPGFLSFPSSHLVPYLRVKRFPRKRHPELYEYRDLESRLISKIKRAFRRLPQIDTSLKRNFYQIDVRNLKLSEKVDVVITSPPYMNALDYGRDNRLRLWFLGLSESRGLDKKNAKSEECFFDLMAHAIRVFDGCVKPGGKIVMIVGEVTRRNISIRTNKIVQRAFRVGGWKLIQQVEDLVPDLRRSRRECRGTKREWIMIFTRVK